MNATPLERILRRDRAIILTAIVVIAALSWIYVLQLARAMDMGGMDMTGWRMVSTGLEMGMVAALEPWSAWQFTLMFAMWTVMMIGMMLPSVTPMILIYARVGRQAAVQGRALAPTGWFASGYLLAWAGFALLATTAQWLLESGALLTPMMTVKDHQVAGMLLIVIGIYQWTPLKDICLRQCQAPLAFVQRHGGFRKEPLGSLALGLRHGAFCVGCCWSLMTALFIGGVMNFFWIAGLAIFVLLEKIVPVGRLLTRIAGAGLVAMGVWMMIASPPS